MAYTGAKLIGYEYVPKENKYKVYMFVRQADGKYKIKSAAIKSNDDVGNQFREAVKLNRDNGDYARFYILRYNSNSVNFFSSKCKAGALQIKAIMQLVQIDPNYVQNWVDCFGNPLTALYRVGKERILKRAGGYASGEIISSVTNSKAAVSKFITSTMPNGMCHLDKYVISSSNIVIPQYVNCIDNNTEFLVDSQSQVDTEGQLNIITACNSELMLWSNSRLKNLKIIDFRHCSNLISIGADQFSGNTDLERVIIDTKQSGLQMGNKAFEGCINLSKFECKGLVDSIGDDAFKNTSISLVDIKVGSNTSLDSFQNNDNLVSLNLQIQCDRDIQKDQIHSNFNLKTLRISINQEDAITLPYGFICDNSQISEVELPESLILSNQFIYDCFGVDRLYSSEFKDICEPGEIHLRVHDFEMMQIKDLPLIKRIYLYTDNVLAFTPVKILSMFKSLPRLREIYINNERFNINSQSVANSLQLIEADRLMVMNYMQLKFVEDSGIHKDNFDVLIKYVPERQDRSSNSAQLTVMIPNKNRQFITVYYINNGRIRAEVGESRV